MKLTDDDSSIVVHTTRGVEGRLPDIWLQWGQMIARLTVDEARELANLLLLEADRVRPGVWTCMCGHVNTDVVYCARCDSYRNP